MLTACNKMLKKNNFDVQIVKMKRKRSQKEGSRNSQRNGKWKENFPTMLEREHRKICIMNGFGISNIS
jgi:hypothetical protein